MKEELFKKDVHVVKICAKFLLVFNLNIYKGSITNDVF